MNRSISTSARKALLLPFFWRNYDERKKTKGNMSRLRGHLNSTNALGPFMYRFHQVQRRLKCTSQWRRNRVPKSLASFIIKYEVYKKKKTFKPPPLGRIEHDEINQINSITFIEGQKKPGKRTPSWLVDWHSIDRCKIMPHDLACSYRGQTPRWFLGTGGAPSSAVLPTFRTRMACNKNMLRAQYAQVV